MDFRWTSGPPPRDLIRVAAWFLGGWVLLAIIGLAGLAAIHFHNQREYARFAAEREAWLAHRPLLRSLFDSFSDPNERMQSFRSKPRKVFLDRFPVGTPIQEVVAALKEEDAHCRPGYVQPGPFQTVQCFAAMEGTRGLHGLPRWTITVTVSEARHVRDAQIAMLMK